MARPRQKKKLRSSKPRVKTGLSGRTKSGKKKVNFLGNDIIAKNWDYDLTLTQNYEKLGLSVRMNAPTGGIEKIGGSESGAGKSRSSGVSGVGLEEVAVERDPETGKILRVIESVTGSAGTSNPLNDPLNDIGLSEYQSANSARSTSVVEKLESQAAAEADEIAQKRKPRKQSAREAEWIARLIEVYGDDTAAMFKDRKLNPMQQSEGDIRKRLKRWRQAHEA